MAAMLLMKWTLSWALTSSLRDISSAFESRTLLENEPSPALDNKENYNSEELLVRIVFQVTSISWSSPLVAPPG